MRMTAQEVAAHEAKLRGPSPEIGREIKANVADELAEIKLIPVFGGLFAIVDSEDFEWLSQYRWRLDTKGYVRAWMSKGLGRKSAKMHRLVNKTPNGFQTDHINRNKLDNRKANLRTVTQQENQWNCPFRKDNSTGYRGVYKTRSGKFFAAISLDGKIRRLGIFTTAIEAHEEFKRVALLYRGSEYKSQLVRP